MDRVVARVNGAPILLSDVNAAIALGVVVPEEGDVQASATAQLIDRQLMLAEVERFVPPEPEAALVDGEVNAMKARVGDRIGSLMQSTGLDEARLRDLARQSLRLQSYLAQRFGTMMQVTDFEVERYYRANPQEFTRNGLLIAFEDAEPVARERAAALRRSEAIAQWVRDLRARAEVNLSPARR